MEIRPIDANALLEYLDQLSEAYNEAYEKSEYGDPHKNILYGKFTTIVETILQIKRKEPTLDYAPVRHGEWVEEIEPNVVTASGRDVHLWRCSVCGFSWANKHDVMSYYKYCPNCGARMDGGKKHD